MAGANCRKAPLLILLLLYAVKTAIPGSAALLGSQSAIQFGLSDSPAAPPARRQLWQTRRDPLQPAFIASGPLEQTRKRWGPAALAASAASQTASCVGMGCRIIGVGSAVPETRITNDDLAQVVDTNDEVRLVQLQFV